MLVDLCYSLLFGNLFSPEIYSSTLQTVLNYYQAHERRHDRQSSLPLGGDKEQDVDEQSSTQASSQNILVWEENLLDNLLNFAATPKVSEIL